MEEIKIKREMICLLLVCFLLLSILAACASNGAAEMTAVPIGTETTEAAETAERTEATEATEEKKYQPAQTTENPSSATAESPDETTQAPLETEAVTETPPATEAPTEPTADLRSLASLCIGCSVTDLYNLIGYPPNGSSYANSCMGNGEDGELYYDGFTVCTYRENGMEIVRSVSP